MLPMQLSAWARRVVGTKSQFIPRYNVDAAKPVMSCKIPPPMEMRVMFLFAERAVRRS